MTAPIEERPLRVGVSSCLLGNEVRFDGGHKRDRFLTDHLGPFVEWVPVCPEVEAGMGVPRPTLRLLRGEEGVRLVETVSGQDHTRRMERFSARRVRALRALDLCGYVLKRDSPSCGSTRVKVYTEKGAPRRDGRGVYAARLIEAQPNLPAEDERRLEDPGVRENFVVRLFAYRRIRALFGGRWTRSRVEAFHAAHELQLMAHSPEACRELGRRVAVLKDTPRTGFRESYEREFMQALGRMPSRGRSAKVLEHAARQLAKQLDPASRGELAELIRDYRGGLVPRVVPISLIRHHVRIHGIGALEGQTFLEPHPGELMLLNHA